MHEGVQWLSGRVLDSRPIYPSLVLVQGEHSAILLTFIELPFVIWIFVLFIFEWPFYPYGKAVFVRISDEYSANCIVHSNCSLYIHILSRIPSEQSWSDKKVIAECLQFVIISLHICSKNKLFSSTRYYSPGIRNKTLVLDTVRSIFVTVTLTFYIFVECSSKELQFI